MMGVRKNHSIQHPQQKPQQEKTEAKAISKERKEKKNGNLLDDNFNQCAISV